MFEILALDAIKGVHLLCLALGMGPAIYFDLRSLVRIGMPFYPVDLAELHRIHKVVTFAFVGLWVSGLTLIWWQTQFDLSKFSPKLWCKIAVVTTLTANAIYLSQCVMPSLRTIVGERLIGLSTPILLPMTLCAGISMSCWVLALALGSSSYLKTADWSVLLPVIGVVVWVCIGGAIALMFGIRGIFQRSQRSDVEYDEA